MRKKIKGIDPDCFEIDDEAEEIWRALGLSDEDAKKFEAVSYNIFKRFAGDLVHVQILEQLKAFKNDAVAQVLAIYTLACVNTERRRAEDEGTAHHVVQNKQELVNLLMTLIGNEQRQDPVM